MLAGAQFASTGLPLAAGAEHTPTIVQFGGNVEMHAENVYAENEVDPRADDRLRVSSDLVLQMGDLLVVGGRLDELTANLGLIGPEVADERALNIPLDQTEILGSRDVSAPLFRPSWSA
jgi:hypothetical protein